MFQPTNPCLQKITMNDKHSLTTIVPLERTENVKRAKQKNKQVKLLLINKVTETPTPTKKQSPMTIMWVSTTMSLQKAKKTESKCNKNE